MAKRDRFGSVSQRSKCFEGHYHASKLEAGYCNQLHALLKNGDIKEIKNQPIFELRVNGNLICKHRPDFLVTENDGTQVVHETKGYETDIWRFKRRLFEAVFPDIRYEVVK